VYLLQVDLLSESELKELKGAFERLDKDHDNRISLEEFYTTVCEQIEVIYCSYAISWDGLLDVRGIRL